MLGNKSKKFNLSTKPSQDLSHSDKQQTDLDQIQCKEDEEKCPICCFNLSIFKSATAKQLHIESCLDRMDRGKEPQFAGEQPVQNSFKQMNSNSIQKSEFDQIMAQLQTLQRCSICAESFQNPNRKFYPKDIQSHLKQCMTANNINLIELKSMTERDLNLIKRRDSFPVPSSCNKRQSFQDDLKVSTSLVSTFDEFEVQFEDDFSSKEAIYKTVTVQSTKPMKRVQSKLDAQDQELQLVLEISKAEKNEKQQPKKRKKDLNYCTLMPVEDSLEKITEIISEYPCSMMKQAVQTFKCSDTQKQNQKLLQLDKNSESIAYMSSKCLNDALCTLQSQAKDLIKSISIEEEAQDDDSDSILLNIAQRTLLVSKEIILILHHHEQWIRDQITPFEKSNIQQSENSQYNCLQTQSQRQSQLGIDSEIVTEQPKDQINEIDQLTQVETSDQKIIDFIKNQYDIYQKVLRYQMVDFNDIQRRLGNSNIKCSKKQLSDILFQQGIHYFDLNNQRKR